MIQRGLKLESGDMLAELLGFREDLFFGWFEIYPNGRLFIHYISSRDPGKGNVKRLIGQWLGMGLEVHCVRPNEIIRHILNERGFTEYYDEIDGYTGLISIWRQNHD